MNYPPPEENKLCQCQGNPMKAFFCGTGHMTECHYPYPCTTAACGHLHKYDFSQEQIERFEKMARDASELGILLYVFDDNGNASVADDVEARIEVLRRRASEIQDDGFHWVPGKAEQLTWFKDSPDAGHPKCICSYCQELIGDGEVPLRVFRDANDGRGEEVRLHMKCAGEVIVEFAPRNPMEPGQTPGQNTPS